MSHLPSVAIHRLYSVGCLDSQSGAGRFEHGVITAVYSVLVEGDDMNEPIADNMRAILDGHIVLSREQAERGQYPAIDVLRSVSRLHSTVSSGEEREMMSGVRRTLSIYESARDMIELGAHQPGSNPMLDLAIQLKPRIDTILAQKPEHRRSRADALAKLSQLAGAGEPHART